MTISVITPCLNEERYLPIFLDSLVAQTDQDFELLVVDGGSEDGTLKILNQYKQKLPQLMLFEPHQRGVSFQRNYGAERATSAHFLFIDADSYLDVDYVRDFKEELHDTQADVATAYIWPHSKNPLDWFFWLNANMLTDLTRYVWPLGYGMNLYVRASLFKQINGFDEQSKVAEDVDLVRRSVQMGGKYCIFKKPKFFTSVRRLRKEGHIGFMLKTMLIAWKAQRKGSFAKVDVEYEMGHWNKEL